MATFTATSGVRFTDTDDRVSFTAGFQSVSTSGGVTDHGALTGLGDDDHTQYLNNARGDARYQPLDSDLTAIAALSTTSFGRALLALADAAAGRTALGLGTAATSATSDFQPVDSDLTAIAALSTTTFGRSLLTSADVAALRSTLGQGWVLLHNETLASDLGTSASPLSYDTTGYSLYRMTMYVTGTRNSTTEGLRVGINGDTGNVYSTDAAALTSAWFVATIPGSLTNTNRVGQVSVEFGGIASSMKSGRAESTNIGSTASVGAADVDVGLFSTITSAITSIQVYGANAALRTGSRIIIEGLA